MTTVPRLSLLAMHRICTPVAWLFLVLVVMVSVQHRIGVFDLVEPRESSLNDDADVEGEEILNKLILANDLVMPYVAHVAPLQGERPVLLAATTLSLLAVRGVASRAPPPASFSA